MPCTCHRDIEKKIASQYQADHPEVIVTEASIAGGAINFTTGGVVYGSSYAIETNVPTKAGGVRRKVVKGLMVFSHCPFCGKPFEAPKADPLADGGLTQCDMHEDESY